MNDIKAMIEAAMADLSKQREHWTTADDTVVAVSARIEHMAGSAYVWLHDGTVEKVAFSYYTDELVFAAAQFVGKTVKQARDMHFGADTAWLRS